MYITDKISSIVGDRLISFHVPGHKMGKIYDLLGYKELVEKMYKMDTTEIPGTDNLHSPDGIIKKSQENTSRIYNSDHTFYLVNGSTCGIHAAIMSVCSPKDKIILNRDCHQSAINACILGDIEPIYIEPNICKGTNIIKGVEISNVIDTIDNNIDAKAICLTYPTYYGMTYDIEEICRYAHSKGIIVIVDEAHGAHLGISNELPSSSISKGADVVIQSIHKTLPAFTQSSLLHINGELVDFNRIQSVLSMIQSSSPSYMLMSSIEIAVDIYDKHGPELMKKLIECIYKFKENFENEDLIDIYLGDDITKIFISMKNCGITGYELEEILVKKYNIQIELSNYYGCLLISTIGNEDVDFIELEKALKSIKQANNKKLKLESIDYPLNIPKKIISPREAFYKSKKNVKIYDSIGKISGEYIIPYPPGISLLSPGEEIEKGLIDYITLCHKKGMNISGIEDKDLEFIKIID